ncbi:MAG: right-handed parallel beta-helix repeat-containing protein [Chloroflexi bacterium]|nr:right-handed parallel beta-helix repeat-containing protein [Chloroflexota bacterium]
MTISKLKTTKKLNVENRQKILFPILIVAAISLALYVHSVEALPLDSNTDANNQNLSQPSRLFVPFGSISTAEQPACTLYVALSGSDSNPGTRNEPFRSIQKAADGVIPGDVVCVADGVYTDDGLWPEDRIVNLNRGGTEQAWVIFRSENMWGAVLDGEDNESDFCWVFGKNASYVRVENFELRGCAEGGFWSNSGVAHHIYIFGNNIHHMGRKCTGTWGGYGLGSYKGGGLSKHTYDSNVIHDNGRYATGENGCDNEKQYELDLAAGKCTEGDKLGCWCPHCYKNHDHGLYLQWGADISVINNLFYNNNRGWSIIVGSRGLTENWIISNNTFANPNPNRCGQIIVEHGMEGVLIQNNIFFKPHENAINIFQPRAQNDVTVRNNLLSPGVGMFCDAVPDGYVLEDNLFDTDPLFVNPSGNDFHLSANSPAIDNGRALSAPVVDIDGNARPQGLSFDIGAYEYVADVVSPTFVDVPLNHWAHDYIEILYQQGYVAGCSTTPLLYCPEATMTRAESAVFVERGIWSADYLPPQPTAQVFSDVPLGEWFAKWADGLWVDGFTAGCGTNPLVFCPLQENTRAEGAVFFLRMMNGADYVPPSASGIFVDVDLAKWYAPWVEAAFNAGLLPACETDPGLRICAEDALDRALGAYMMVQAKGLSVP